MEVVVSMSEKPVLAISFIDCVVQNYDKDGFVVDGFFNWAVEAHRHFDLVVYSDQIDTETMETFVRNFQISWRHQKLADAHLNAKDELVFNFVQGRPPAFLTIDARTLTFTGRWDMPFLNPTGLVEFKQWTEPQILYKLPEDLGRPDAAQRRAASVAPPPDAIRKCPRHPWMTRQNNDGSRECQVTSCSWRADAPVP
jgi:hypothetical protein